MLVIPYTRNLGYSYNRSIIVMSFIASAVVFVVHIVNYATNLHDDVLLDMDAYTYLIAAIQMYQCYPLGLYSLSL